MAELRDVSFSYGKKKIIDQLSIRILPGECVVFAGPNGSGKSTALSILAGVLRPRSGEVAVKEKTGYVPQGVALFEDMTVGENIRFFSGKGRTAESGVPSLHIEEIWGQKVSKLSEGMKKRVSIACALMVEPQLVLLDEPCAALDVDYKEEVAALVRTLKGKGCAIVYVTHDPMEVSSFYDRLVFFGERITTYSRDQLSGQQGDDGYFYQQFLSLFQNNKGGKEHERGKQGPDPE